MKRYKKYKNSGVEWIGQIPEHWDVKRMKYVSAKKKFAIVDGPFGTQLKANEYTTEGIPLIRITNLSYTGELSENDIVYISEEKAEEVKRSCIFLNDIIIGKTGATIGKSGLNNKFKYAIIASSCLKISPDKIQIFPSYLKYFICSNNFQHEMIETSGGSTRDTINIEPFKNLLCILPNYEEQTAIAEYLDEKTAQIDKLITNKQKLIELLKEERIAIINHAVTRGIDPNVKLKSSGIDWLGKIPQHWEVKKIKHIAKIVLGKMLTNEDKGNYYLKPYLRAANLQWLNVDVSDVKDMWFSQTELHKLKLNKYDLLVSEGGEVGRTCIWNDELEECYIQNSVHKITIDNKYNSFYFLYQFCFLGSIGFFESIVNRISIAHLTGEKIKEIYIFLPPSVEQNKIVQHIETETKRIDSTIAKIEKEIELLQEYRTALISEAVTGKIKVTNEP